MARSALLRGDAGGGFVELDLCGEAAGVETGDAVLQLGRIASLLVVGFDGDRDRRRHGLDHSPAGCKCVDQAAERVGSFSGAFSNECHVKRI